MKSSIVYLNASLATAILVLFVLGCDAWVTINSRVLDETGRPVDAAKVTVFQGTTQVAEELTARNGAVKIFESITPGPFGGTRTIRIVVTKDGFEPSEISFDWSKDGAHGGEKTRTIILKKVVLGIN